METTGTYNLLKKTALCFVIFGNQKKIVCSVCCCSIKIHELSELKDISNVVRLDDETKGEDFPGTL